MHQTQSLASKIPAGPSPGEALCRQLDSATLPGEVSVAAGHGRARCSVRRLESIGCELDRLEVEMPGGDKSPERVRRGASEIARRVTYLDEPLEVLEVDAAAGEAIVRSRAPWRDGPNREYYEASVKPQGVVLRRFRKSPDEPRDEIAWPMTRGTLKRLVDDLADAVGG